MSETATMFSPLQQQEVETTLSTSSSATLNTSSSATSSNDVKKHFGTKENGMTLIGPPTSTTKDDLLVLKIIQEMNHIMKQPPTKTKFIKWISSNANKDNSIRWIQGGRMEIFLQAHGKSTQAFDTIVANRLSHPHAKDLLLNYAKRQAYRDPRIQESSTSGNNYTKFGNFSLIVSYKRVDAQAPHIDLIKPNHQFGLMISANTNSTKFLLDDDVEGDQPPQRIHTVNDLIHYWQNVMEKEEEEKEEVTSTTISTTTLQQALRKEPAIADLIRWFGNVLLSPAYIHTHMKMISNIPPGSLMSLPGSVVHAAPSASTYRAVIFFSGWPSSQQPQQNNSDNQQQAQQQQEEYVPEYNPDTQYTGVFLLGQIVSILWKNQAITIPDKIYLLKRLAQYVDQQQQQQHGAGTGMSGHFPSGNLANFVKTIEQQQQLQLFNSSNQNKKWKIKRQQYIDKMATDCKEMEFDDTVTNNALIFNQSTCSVLKDYQLVSVPNLYTIWDDKEYSVEIYRRNADNKIVLRYPPPPTTTTTTTTQQQQQPQLQSQQQSQQQPQPHENHDPNFHQLEGHNQEDNYRLLFTTTMQDAVGDDQHHQQQQSPPPPPPPPLLFDGTNGKLLDTDGDEIKCFVQVVLPVTTTTTT